MKGGVPWITLDLYYYSPWENIGRVSGCSSTNSGGKSKSTPICRHATEEIIADIRSLPFVPPRVWKNGYYRKT